MKSIFRNSLFGLVALLAFVGMFTPETLYAIGTCSSLPPSGIFPEIDIAVTGYGTFSNSSPTNPNTSYNISVPSGTSLSIHVDTFAEPSTRNSMSYPGGSEIIYSGPNGRMGDGRDYTSGVITGSSQIHVSVGPNNCTPITDGETSSVTVNVTVAPTYTLTVAKAGTGTGTITSSPAGINYGADNSEAYASGTSVTLSQVAAGGSTFAGWSGACSGTGACVVSMTQARSVTATFNAAGYTLTASKAGTGTGTITSSPAGINCGADCSEVYASGTSVGLTATPTGGSTFAGWSGSPDCSNDAGGAMANPTSVMMNAAKSCTATFDTVSPLSCSASPSTVAVGQSVTITASGGSGGTSPFYTWSTGSGGGSCVSGGTCTTSYSSSGTKTVTVTRNGVNATCPVSVSTDTTPTGALTSTASCTATGWADDADTTATRPVRIYSDGSLVSTVTAGTVGCSGTGCTFSSNLTGLVSTGVAHSITGTVQGDDTVWYALSNPMSMTCPATGVTCSGPTAGQTGTTYSFTATGGAAHTWSASSAAGTMTPSGTTGSGSSVSKSFSAAGTKTITFTRTDTGATGSCTIDITTTPPALTFNLQVNSSEGPLTVAYNTPITLSWVSGGADTVQSRGATPADALWGIATIADSGTQVVSPATVRRQYDGRAVKSNPLPVTTNTDSVIVRVTPECLPAGQSITTGGTANLTARGGNGTYAWTSVGGSPTSGAGASYNVTYATAGTYNVGLTSDALTATNCTVTVSDAPVTTGTVVVNSNIATTWSLSGPSGVINENTDQTTETYSNMEGGSYTLSNIPDITGYEPATISPASSQALSAGGTITFTINYVEEGTGGGDGVDLQINGSNNPTPVASGSDIDLSWTTHGVSEGSCVASDGIAPWGGSVGENGNQTITLSDDATFTITCDSTEKGADPLTDSVSILATFPECSDGIENDNDGDIDYPTDDGCPDPLDNSEAVDNDDTGGEVTECSDGFDNDGDGGIDYDPSRGGNGDVNCSSLLDDDERGSPDIREI